MERKYVNYYVLPWYRKLFYKIVDFIYNIIQKIRSIFTIRTLITVFLFIIVIGVIWAIIHFNRATFILRDAYNKDGYIHFDDVKQESYILENSKFSFELDAKTTSFVLKDKSRNVDYTALPSDNKSHIAELFTIAYENKLEVPKELSVLNDSVELHDYYIKSNYMQQRNHASFCIFLIKEIKNNLLHI